MLAFNVRFSFLRLSVSAPRDRRSGENISVCHPASEILSFSGSFVCLHTYLPYIFTYYTTCQAGCRGCKLPAMYVCVSVCSSQDFPEAVARCKAIRGSQRRLSLCCLNAVSCYVWYVRVWQTDVDAYIQTGVLPSTLRIDIYNMSRVLSEIFLPFPLL